MPRACKTVTRALRKCLQAPTSLEQSGGMVIHLSCCSGARRNACMMYPGSTSRCVPEWLQKRSPLCGIILTHIDHTASEKRKQACSRIGLLHFPQSEPAMLHRAAQGMCNQSANSSCSSAGFRQYRQDHAGAYHRCRWPPRACPATSQRECQQRS